MQRVDDRFSRTARGLTLGLAAVVAIVLPVGYFTMARQHLTGALEAETRVTAAVISREVSAHPGTWHLQAHRLEMLLSGHEREQGERRRIYGAGSAVVAELPGTTSRWSIIRRAAIHDAGIKVADLEISRPLGVIVQRTGLAALFGLLLGGTLFAVLQWLPLRALARSERRLHAVLQSARDAILIIDDSSRILSSNRSAAPTFGRGSVELDETLLTALIAPSSRAPYEAAWRETRNGPADHPREPIELEGVRSDGTVFPIEASLSSWRDGARVYGGVIIRDVTERHRAAEALRESEERLRHAQRLESIGKLAGGVAHDFNNLLTVMAGRIALVLDALPASGPIRSDIERVSAAIDRATRITRQLLAFSRRQVLQPRVLDLNEALTVMTSSLSRLVGGGIELSIAPAPSPALVKVDPGQVEQVLTNLAVNARDAMPEGGRLGIAVREALLDHDEATRRDLTPGRYVVVAVADTGHGMDAATQSRIFEPFFTTKEVGKGSGLGLATVHGIVSQSGGHIGVESEAGRGTTFTILLPGHAGPVDVARPTPPAPPGAAQTILLVEVEEEARRVARDVLTADGYRVLAVSGGADALEIASRHEGALELCITGVVMPGMSGRELAERLGIIRPAARILYVAGRTDDIVRRPGVESGSQAFLEKPFTMDALRRKVHDVLATPGGGVVLTAGGSTA